MCIVCIVYTYIDARFFICVHFKKVSGPAEKELIAGELKAATMVEIHIRRAEHSGTPSP
jgi:hypothetical protein